MQGLMICALLFVLMMAGPIFFAAIYSKKYRGAVLSINQNKEKNPRYFGVSFAKLIEKNLPNSDGNIIKLSKDEIYIDGDTYKDYDKENDQIIISRKKVFQPPTTIRAFNKEIYCAENGILEAEEDASLTVRAIYSKKNLVFKDRVQVVRWADAQQSLTVYDNCGLGISCTASEQIYIGKNCRFRRLYAREIKVGQYIDSGFNAMDGKDPKILRLYKHNSNRERINYIGMEKADSSGMTEISVISMGNTVIDEDLIVRGDVRSHKGIRLCDRVVVCGNLFAEEEIRIGKDAIVLGSIFSQGSIYLEEGSVVGQKGRISSIIAGKDIVFEGKGFVFGYVSCEGRGLIMPEAGYELDDDSKTQNFRQNVFPKSSIQLESLLFKTAEQFNAVDKQAFRKANELKEVLVPFGATIIPQSMFFSCTSLIYVDMAPDIVKIGDFAFADCFSLKRVYGLKRANLSSLGISAFENCRSLESIKLPATLKSMGGAAFSGCLRLETVQFAENSTIEIIGDHCFSGCISLREFRIPPTVKSVGVSAFKDCRVLERIYVPDTCIEEPGISEIGEILPNCQLVVYTSDQIIPINKRG